MDRVAALPQVEQLSKYVLEMLCSNDRLDPEQTPMRRAVIKRGGRPCGLFFEVQGPRLLRAHAVWAGEEDRILFYDSTGQRFAIVRLSEAPDPLKLAG